MSGPPANIHNTLGLLYIITVITAALYGLGMLQAWFYYRQYSKRDNWAIKGTVAFVLICDTAQMALLAAAVYVYAVTWHDDPAAMLKMEKTIMIELFFSGGIALGVQQFYCWRIYLLSKSYLVSGAVSALSWASLILLYVYSAKTISFPSLAALVSETTLCTTLNTFAAATDVVISVVMIYYLQQSKTGFKKTADMINRLIIFTFNTGLPTSVCAIADVITLHTLANTFVYMGFFLLMGRFYTNSLLVTLNSRGYIRDGSSSDEVSQNESFSLSRFGPSAARSAHTGQEPISIRIDRTTVNDNDSKEYGDGKASAV